MIRQILLPWIVLSLIVGACARSAALTTPSNSPVPPEPRYAIQDIRAVSMPGRVRYSANVILPGTHTQDEVATVLASAARSLLATRSDALAVVVFGYRDASETKGSMTLGKAEVSRDGKGWGGDGKMSTDPDNNLIHLELVTEDILNHERRTVPR